MLVEHKAWGASGADAAANRSASLGDDRRRAERVSLVGGEVFLFLDDEQRYRLRLRDLCSLGLSGLTDAPVGVGEQIIVQLEEMLMPAAKVVWTRCAMIGLAFVNPLPLTRLKRMRERHAAGIAWSPAMRAGSDLHSWWTDATEQARGRRPRLNAGGHDHPLAR